MITHKYLKSRLLKGLLQFQVNVLTNATFLIAAGPLYSCPTFNNICAITNLNWRGWKIDPFIVQFVEKVLPLNPPWELIIARYVVLNLLNPQKFRKCSELFKSIQVIHHFIMGNLYRETVTHPELGAPLDIQWEMWVSFFLLFYFLLLNIVKYCDVMGTPP